MKRTVLLGLSTLLAGCMTQTCRYGEFIPKTEAKPSRGGVFSDYSKAMAHHDGYEMAYEWQQANREAIRCATSSAALCELVATDAAADALLSKIGTSYEGDPLVLTQISGVTQLVMAPNAPCARKILRRRWIAALKRCRRMTDDGYVRTFCDQQLRLCE